jgi:beta-galactosidase/beta-glucuronidase
VVVDVADAHDLSASMQLEGQPSVQAKVGAAGKIELVQILDHPKLWSAEFPNLYTLSVDLKSADGQVIEHLSKRVGVREVSIENGIFKINHVPVKLVGICRHDLYPTEGSAITSKVWKQDLALMKAANFNAVRTSHYPYGSGFYDLCDEMGFYVVAEEPFCWINCDKPDEWPMFDQRVREAVGRDKNHPCVVMWNVGNENPIGRNNVKAANLTAELDPSRPRLICSCTAGQNGANTDFDDRHYVNVDRIKKDENDPRRAKWPEIYTENPNVWDVRNGPDFGSLDLWSNVIERTWREVWKDDHIVGTFLWEWADRAVSDHNPEKRYYWYPETGINLLKTKGIVDAFRDPRPDYYHCKMAQTPIAIADKPQISDDGVALDVTNRYAFTNLSELSANWHLIKSGADLTKGTAKLALAPRSSGQVHLALPADALRQADTLRVDFDHAADGQAFPDGWNVVTYQFALKPVETALPQVTAIKELNFPRFNLLEGKVVKDDVGWKKLASNTGQLVNISIAGEQGASAKMDEATLLATPMSKVHALDADITFDPAKPAVGRLHADFDGSKLAYQVKWTGGKSDIYELGWEFKLPKGIDHFSWSRKALWSYYPPGHIGRPTGTATPDSCKDQLTHTQRPDAFDFNSTKFDCDWASLTSADNRGLLVQFESSQRQHVRGGVSEDGSCTLVINRKYSPPQDISTGVVPDLYTHLKSGDEVSGSFKINPE